VQSCGTLCKFALLFHFLLSAHPTISARDGEPDAEKPDPRGVSPFADYGKKEIEIHLDPA